MRKPDMPTQIIIAVCVIVWIVCAIKPWDMEAWLLEQFASICGLGFLFWCVYKKIHFSLSAKISIACMFIAHTIGTHFTYSLTPYDSFFSDLFGISINELFEFDRNHYDRFVHLLYGMTLALPAASMLEQRLQVTTFRAHLFTFHLIISTSALYELVEWGAAIIFGGDLGTMYLGTQGDVWDAQIDIALAGVGQLTVMSLHHLYIKLSGSSHSD